MLHPTGVVDRHWHQAGGGQPRFTGHLHDLGTFQIHQVAHRNRPQSIGEAVNRLAIRGDSDQGLIAGPLRSHNGLMITYWRVNSHTRCDDTTKSGTVVLIHHVYPKSLVGLVVLKG